MTIAPYPLNDLVVRISLTSVLLAASTLTAGTSAFAQQPATGAEATATTTSTTTATTTTSTATTTDTSATTTSTGASSVDPQRREQARALFRQGVEAFQRNKYGDAVLAFERSLRLNPHPFTAYNLAEARMNGGDTDGAIETLRILLAMKSPPPDAAMLERARTLAERAGVHDLTPMPETQAQCPECRPTIETRTVVTAGPAGPDRTIVPAILGVGGGVLLAMGGGFYGAAAFGAETFRNPSTPQALQLELRAQGDTYRVVGLFGFILGLAAEGAAVALLVRPAPPPPPASSARTIRPQAPALSIAHIDVTPSGFLISGSF